MSVASGDAVCRVAMYHYVRPDYTAAGIFGLTPEGFEAQLRALATRYRMLEPEEFRRCVESGELFPDKSCLLTFDDGLKDHIAHARPILDRLGLRGLFFITTAPLLEGRVTTTHKVHLLRRKLGEEAFADAFRRALPKAWRREFAAAVVPGAPGDDRHYRWDGAELRRLKSFINYRLAYDVAEPVLNSLFVTHIGAEEVVVRSFYLSWEDIAELDAGGHGIGGHGHHHRIYARLDAEAQDADIATNLSALAERLGEPVWSFAYPFGKADTFTAGTAHALQRDGIVCAFTSEPGTIVAADDPYAYRRMDPRDLPEAA